MIIDILNKFSKSIDNNILYAFLIIIISWLLGHLIKYITTNKLINNNNPALIRLLGKAIKNILLIIGIISALGTIGVDISAMVAGLGLTGFAVGFAMKDILSNMISGILILLYQPFLEKDIIKIDKYEGEVLEINLRYTSIKQNEEIVLIPNSFIYSKPISVKSN